MTAKAYLGQARFLDMRIPGVLGKNIIPYESPCQLWRKALAELTNRFNLANRPVYAVSRLLPPD